jgi:hypothetical protein
MLSVSLVSRCFSRKTGAREQVRIAPGNPQPCWGHGGLFTFAHRSRRFDRDEKRPGGRAGASLVSDAKSRRDQRWA